MPQRHLINFAKFLAVLSAAYFLVLSPLSLKAEGESAGPTAVLEDKMTARKNEIEALEKEIEKDRAEISRLSSAQKTLSNEIKLIDTTRKKVQKEISVTTNNIGIKEDEIEDLSGGIAEKERSRTRTVDSIAETIRSIQRIDDTSFVESLLSKESLSVAWEDLDMMNALQSALSSNLASIILIKNELEGKKKETEQKLSELSAYKAKLADQKSVIDYTTREKNKLLSSAKNQESQYQKMLAEKLAKKEAFERELLAIEAELRFITDPSMIPEPNKNLLNWPISPRKITQIFGDTEFSRANPGVYNGKGHNGIDLGAPIGTAITSAESGIVEGVGDTDKVCPNASYGKWVLIKHKNGLSTLYAHLSVVKVQTGEEIRAGQTIGYVGMTGYTTGPHLHFTVYATQGVRILNQKSKICGGTYTMPIADLRAYLNPLLYLPN